jgi:hypothetical protein
MLHHVPITAGLPGPILCVLAAETPQLMVLPMPQLEESYEQLSQVFGLGPVDMARIIAVCPVVLGLTGREVCALCVMCLYVL